MQQTSSSLALSPRLALPWLLACLAACGCSTPDSTPSTHSESAHSESAHSESAHSESARSPKAADSATPVAADSLEGVAIEVSFAKNFRAADHGSFKTIQLRNGDHESWRETLVLVPRGTRPPPLEGDLADAVLIETPVRSIATNAVSDLSRLRALGLTDRLVALPTAAVFDEQIYRRYEQGELKLIGHPGHGQPNLEALIAAGPDLTLILSTGPDHAHGLRRIRDLGLAAAPSYAFSESTFLGQAEWIVFIALFFGAEDAARTYFDEVLARYRSISQRAKAAAGASPPVAFWGGPAGGNRWWVESNGPEAALLADAGARNPLADPSAGPFATLDTASVLSAAAEAAVWFTSALDEREWDRRAPVERFAAYRSGQVFHNRKRMRPERDAWDWNETAISRPDLALADVVSLLHPGLLPDHELHFFGPVARRSE